MTEVRVTRVDDGTPLTFRVVVDEDGAESRHTVTMSRATLGELTDGQTGPEATVEAAFRFLLDREPKEAILAEFDVTVIEKYFPEFRQEIGGYL